MKILIDTHVFLWASGKTARLSEETLDLLANPETEKFLSVASVWEIAIKYGKGLLPLPEHPKSFIPLTLAASDVSPITITLRDSIGVTDLPNHHGDPFDRLLISQARLNGMYLLTDDKVFEKYDVDLINLRSAISMTKEAIQKDHVDHLGGFRERFHFPEPKNGIEPIYFTGNSLGLMPKKAREYVQQELRDWEALAVEGHTHAKNPWLPYHEFLTEQMAHVIGAKPIETVVMNALTVNLHLLMVSFYRPTRDRYRIVIEKGAFPSDQYAVESQIRFHAYEPGNALIELTARMGESTLRTDDIIEVIQREGDSIALILLGGVNYYTGQVFDMQAITKAGHKAGAMVGFDLAHAAGNIEMKMHDWDVDFAAWCSYKYLNGGPGAVGGAFIHERHAESFDLPRFAGWWGHDKETRFLMGPEFKPLSGAEGWQISNPPILQMAALRASLEIFEEAGMEALTEKSRKLTGYLESLIDGIGDERISIITPRDPGQRGCQLSISVRDADRSLHERIVSRGVFADWREPDVIRVAPVPLYNSFDDVFRFAQILQECLV